jgi:hypothetical protein
MRWGVLGTDSTRAGEADITAGMVLRASPSRFIPPYLPSPRVEAEGLALPLGPLARLAQIDESGLRGGSARGGRGLVQLTYISVCLTDFRQGVFT